MRPVIGVEQLPRLIASGGGMADLHELIELHKRKLQEAQQKGDTANARKWARLLDLLLREE